jgi:hypothetical protein
MTCWCDCGQIINSRQYVISLSLSTIAPLWIALEYRFGQRTGLLDVITLSRIGLLNDFHDEVR